MSPALRPLVKIVVSPTMEIPRGQTLTLMVLQILVIARCLPLSQNPETHLCSVIIFAFEVGGVQDYCRCFVDALPAFLGLGKVNYR